MDDLELIRELRVEWRKAFEEGMELREKKGFVDSEARTKCERIEKDLNDKTDAHIAALTKRVDDTDVRVKGLMERSSRPPGAEGGLIAPATSFAEKIVQSDAWKNCTFNGRFQM